MKLGYGGGAIADYPWHLNGQKIWMEKDSEQALECLRNLDELDYIMIDTANRYGSGISEAIIGKAIRMDHVPANIGIFTKIELADVEIMEMRLNESTQRLGRIEGVLLHNPDFRSSKIDEACDWIKHLPGIKFFGMSTEPCEEVEMYYDKYGLNAIEFPYSVWDQRAERSILSWISGNGEILKIGNRILGGPRKDLTTGMVELALNFVFGKLDIALIGTTNLFHLQECSRIAKRIKGAMHGSKNGA